MLVIFQRLSILCKSLKELVQPEEFESPASAFGGQRSIQLSYGCKLNRTRCIAQKP